MEYGDKHDKNLQISSILVRVMKALGVLGCLSFVAGIFNGVFSVGIIVALFFFIPAIICFVVALNLEKEAEQIEKDIRSSRIKQKQNDYESNQKIALEGYRKVCSEMRKPFSPILISVYSFSTTAEMINLQSEGKFWQDAIRMCECWLHMSDEVERIGELYFIETIDSFKEKVKNLPNYFSDIDSAVGQVWRKKIPFGDIIGISLVGDVSTTSTISGGDAKYIGVSVNGIGFGELQIDPIQIRQDVHDKRVIELKYRDNDEIVSIFFPLESLSALQRMMARAPDVMLSVIQKEK